MPRRHSKKSIKKGGANPNLQPDSDRTPRVSIGSVTTIVAQRNHNQRPTGNTNPPPRSSLRTSRPTPGPRPTSSRVTRKSKKLSKKKNTHHR